MRSSVLAIKRAPTSRASGQDCRLRMIRLPGTALRRSRGSAGVRKSFGSQSPPIPSPFDITSNLTDGNGPCVGSFAEMQHVFDQASVNAFAALVGDNNPIHSDQEYAAQTPFGSTIVHGILVSSLFSTLFGRTIHGCIYVNQTLSFKKPVFVGSPISARIEVLEASDSRRGLLLSCSTKIYTSNSKLARGPIQGTDAKQSLLAVDGVAKVLIPTESLNKIRNNGDFGDEQGV